MFAAIEHVDVVVPVDADLSDPNAVRSLVGAPDLSAAAKDAARRLLVFDSCRNNPADGWRQQEAADLAGGFTGVACIPNTEPPIDTQAAVEFVRQKAARADTCNVYVVGCVSRGREGKELAEIGRLVEAGAVAFSDDGAPVYDAELMRRALEYCAMFGKPILAHEEVLELSRNFGQHAATLAGMSSSSGEWIVTMDEDGQHNPDYIGSMLDFYALTMIDASLERVLLTGVP